MGTGRTTEKARSIRATRSGPANSNSLACFCPKHHTTLRISDTQGPTAPVDS